MCGKVFIETVFITNKSNRTAFAKDGKSNAVKIMEEFHNNNPA